MESSVKFMSLPDGAHASVRTLAAMIADNLDRLLRVWRFSAPERDHITPYTYAAAFHQGPGECVCVVARLCLGMEPEQSGAGAPYRVLQAFLTQRHIHVSEQIVGSDRIPSEALIQPFLIQGVKAAVSDHWTARYQEIFAGIEAKVSVAIEEERVADISARYLT